MDEKSRDRGLISTSKVVVSVAVVVVERSWQTCSCDRRNAQHLIPTTSLLLRSWHGITIPVPPNRIERWGASRWENETWSSKKHTLMPSMEPTTCISRTVRGLPPAASDPSQVWRGHLKSCTRPRQAPPSATRVRVSVWSFSGFFAYKPLQSCLNRARGSRDTRQLRVLGVSSYNPQVEVLKASLRSSTESCPTHATTSRDKFISPLLCRCRRCRAVCHWRCTVDARRGVLVDALRALAPIGEWRRIGSYFLCYCVHGRASRVDGSVRSLCSPISSSGNSASRSCPPSSRKHRHDCRRDFQGVGCRLLLLSRSHVCLAMRCGTATTHCPGQILHEKRSDLICRTEYVVRGAPWCTTSGRFGFPQLYSDPAAGDVLREMANSRCFDLSDGGNSRFYHWPRGSSQFACSRRVQNDVRDSVTIAGQPGRS